ncbi:MAG: cytochrome c3 family protein [Acidobacteria bacterium]|nr:cytochrome c3 family protein [Acidobacteriota bacterium]
MRVLLFITGMLLPVFGEPSFSHKRHASLNLECTFCHTGAVTRERAGFPAWKTCHTCHTGKAEQPIPSQRIYKLPDFVFFSHARHATAQVDCTSCHGNVKKQAKIELYRSTKMAACVDCHKENRATVVCNACHELGQ